MARSRTHSDQPTLLTARGFSLIEMLTVLLILSIVLAIIVPAIGKSRTAARRADTVALLNQVGNACLAFAVDEKRPPGYFSALEMGSNVNGAQVGFDNMSNIMLDLVGGIVPSDTPLNGTVLEVGPFTNGDAKNIRIDTTLMGASRQNTKGAIAKGYFQFDAKRFVVQNNQTPSGGDRMPGSPSSNNTIFQLPVLVDTFGSPVLAWSQDDSPAAAATFGAVNGTAAARARFYSASNAGFLNSQRLGKLGEDQRFTGGTNPSGSLLNDAVTAAKIALSLEGFLGNPASPIIPTPATGAAPASARAPVVIHSAGEDGIYLGSRERGGRVALGQAAPYQNAIKYTPNQDPITGGGFNDMIQAAGN